MAKRLKLPDPEHCIRCGTKGRVLVSVKKDGYRWRRMRCRACGHRWSTFLSVLSPARVRVRPKATKVIA